MVRLAFVLALLVPSSAFAAGCPLFSEPVRDLSFSSRYASDDDTKSTIDPVRAAQAEAALEPLDDFISGLADRTDIALAENDRDAAACVLSELAYWARADALSELATETVELTIGSRLAALAMIAGQVGSTGRHHDLVAVKSWLARRMEEQMTFWETGPNGSAQGNLRAWSGLAGAAVSLLTDDPMLRGWSAWSISYVACTANPDGSLPQEMKRGRLALHYQLHAVAPLAVAAALLEQQGMPMMRRCDRALDRIVTFTLSDLSEGGAKSQALTGEAQSLDKGLDGLKNFQLAWGEAWLKLRPDRVLLEAVAGRRPLRYSKLGGDQTRIWNGGY